MRVKEVFLVSAFFLAALILVFPYDAAVRYGLARFVPPLRYETLQASPWGGVRMGGVTLQAPSGQKMMAEQLRIRPAGIFPPKCRIETTNGRGQITAFVWGSPRRPHFQISAVNPQEFVSVFRNSAGFSVDVNASGQFEVRENVIHVQEIHMKADIGGFEGTAELQPAFPLKSAVLHLKGVAVVGGQSLPMDKSIVLSDLFGSE